MNIVIFDDDISFIELMKKSLIDLNIKHNGIFAEPTYISNVESILAYAEVNKENSTSYILDIMTDDIQTGFEIGKRIKEFNSNNLVIYVTDFKEKILTNITNKVLAFCFILKDSDIFHEELEECLLKAYDYFTDMFFIAKRGSYIVKIKLKNIYYFEKEKNTEYINIVTKNDCISIRESLVNVMKRLNSNFCYSTKEFIVNKQAITRLNKKDKIVHFPNGNECPYSRNHQKELNAWMLKS